MSDQDCTTRWCWRERTQLRERAEAAEKALAAAEAKSNKRTELLVAWHALKAERDAALAAEASMRIGYNHAVDTANAALARELLAQQRDLDMQETIEGLEAKLAAEKAKPRYLTHAEAERDAALASASPR